MLVNSNDITKSNPVLYILRIIGELWNQNIYIWRVFTLSLTLAVSGVTAYFIVDRIIFLEKSKIKKWEKFLLVQIAIIISFCHFTWHPTLDYNLICILVSYLWLILGLSYAQKYKNEQSFFYLIIWSFLIIVTLFFKFQFFIILCLSSLIIIFIRNNSSNISDILIFFLATIIQATLSIFYFSEYLSLSFNSILSSTEGSHSLNILMIKYIDDLIHFTTCNIIHPLLCIIFVYYFSYICFIKKHSNSYFNSFFILLIFVFSFFYFNNFNLKYLTTNDHNRYLYGFIISFILFILLFQKQSFSLDKLNLFILFTTIQLHCLGTNTILLTMTSLSIVPLFSFLISWLTVFYRTSLLYILLLISCTFYAYEKIKTYQLTSYRRNSQFEHQSTNIDINNRLKDLKIEDDIAQIFFGLDKNLSSFNFNKSLDLVIGFPDIPGILAGLETKSLGIPWKTTSYQNSDSWVKQDIMNCFNSLDKSQRIFLVIDRSFSKSLNFESFINNNFSKLNDFTDIEIGSFYHYGRKEIFNCHLIGPYSI